MAYAKLTDTPKVKGWMRSTSSTDDGLIGSLIDSLSAQVGRLLGRDNLGSVESYVETYRIPRWRPNDPAELLLRHWPVVALTSVKISAADVAIITDAMAAVGAGVLVEDDRRTLAFYGADGYPAFGGVGLPLCQIRYTAGYAAADIPPGLTHAVNQWVAEITKSQDWIGYVSKSLAGETVTFEQGRTWGMSKRTKEMLEPYRDRIPMSGAL